MGEVADWSITAASNTSAPPDGFPENQQQSTYNDCARELMARLKRWYNDPEWLDLVKAFTVSRVDATHVLIAGVDATAFFPVERRVLITGGGNTEGYVTASVYSAPDTTLTLDATVPVGTNHIWGYIGKTLRSAAFLKTGTGIGQIPVNTVAAALGAAAYKAVGNVIGDAALHTSAAALATGAYKAHGNTIGDLALHTATGPLQSGAYARKPERTYARKSADQTITGGAAEALITTLSNIAPVVVVSGGAQRLVATIVAFNNTGTTRLLILRVRVGATGTTADAEKWRGEQTISPTDNEIITFMAQIIPFTGDKVSLTAECPGDTIIRGHASERASQVEIMDFGDV